MTRVTINLERAHYQTHITTGKHVIWADEPPENGGQDEGMEPFELLLASLGSCTAITVRMYADRKGWPLEAIEISLTLVQDTDRKTTRIHKRIDLKGELSDDERKRLLQIADRCPVHRLLLNPLELTSELVEG